MKTEETNIGGFLFAAGASGRGSPLYNKLKRLGLLASVAAGVLGAQAADGTERLSDTCWMTHAKPPVCPVAPDWTYNAAMSDEFSGTRLDRTKWCDWVRTFQGRSADRTFSSRCASGYGYSPDNVTVTNGELVLTARMADARERTRRNEYLRYGPFSTAICRSVGKHGYGYFEIRMKAMAACVSNAFWLYDPHSSEPKVKFGPGDISEEIDIFEVTGRPDSRDPNRDQTRLFFPTMFWYFTPFLEGIVNTQYDMIGQAHVEPIQNVQTDFNFADGYHVVGFRWTPETLTWYLDGKVRWERKNELYHRPLHITFDSEIFNDWFGVPDPADLPAHYRIDYFRVWDAPPPRNTALVARTKIEPDSSYDWFKRHDLVLRHREKADVVLLGDGVSQNWAGKDSLGGEFALPRWRQAFAGKKAVDLGCAWDRTGNVLWRLNRGELDGVDPSLVILQIGGNNFATTRHYEGNTSEEVAEGVLAVADKIHEKAPRARIVVMGVVPRDGAHLAKARAANAALAKGLGARGFAVLLDLTDALAAARTGDELTHAGYALWAKELKSVQEGQSKLYRTDGILGDRVR